MPGSGRIPNAGEVILLRGTLLQEELATRIEDQYVDRAMFQSAAMNFRARELADHFIAFIDDIKNFVVHQCVLAIECLESNG